MMLVGDLIYSTDFDCNCPIELYDVTESDKPWSDGAELIFSTKTHGWNKPLDTVLDMRIKYITIKDNILIVECCR